MPDCKTRDKYLKERKAKKEAQQKSKKKECISMANAINFSPVKISLEEEESHNSVSTTSPNIIYTAAPTVPLLSLDDPPAPHLPNFDDNAFDIYDLHFEIDYRQ
jgi:hypothetical protein